MRLYALRNPSIRASLLSAEQGLDQLLATAISRVVEQQDARLRVPVDQMLILLDAYCEAIWVEALMAGRDPGDTEVGEQLARMVRTVVAFPDQDT